MTTTTARPLFALQARALLTLALELDTRLHSDGGHFSLRLFTEDMREFAMIMAEVNLSEHLDALTTALLDHPTRRISVGQATTIGTLLADFQARLRVIQ